MYVCMYVLYTLYCMFIIYIYREREREREREKDKYRDKYTIYIMYLTLYIRKKDRSIIYIIKFTYNTHSII